MAINAQSLPPDPIEPGVSLELAKWRAAHYSDVRYKLNLTLEKMSPVLKGTIEIRVKIGAGDGAATLLSPSPQSGETPPIILDWRKIKGHEEKSTITNVSINGSPVQSASFSSSERDESRTLNFTEQNEHLVFRDGVVMGENVIKLDFTSPILSSGSAITRYVDKEDGSEYIYSLFVPSNASTAFPVFDQPDLKARFELRVKAPTEWTLLSNGTAEPKVELPPKGTEDWEHRLSTRTFSETKPISTYVFAFAAGPWERVTSQGVSSPHVRKGAVNNSGAQPSQAPSLTVGLRTPETSIYVRKSQAVKLKPHAAEVFRLNREAVKYFEEYFDYKFPFPKYDLVLIPEFPFGGMEHAGATFLREASIIFPQEPTKNDHINRATLIFHEAAHQWFGDTVTMRWFDDLWLKEGFATFTAYKALEKIMPEMNAWKIFYERVKQGAYATDSTKGTTPIYQEIPNLSAAKSAYGNIVYNKAPAFLRQAEFYLGEDKFQTAVRAFLKKHEFGNATWEDLVKEFEGEGTIRPPGSSVRAWAETWVKERGLGVVPVKRIDCKLPSAFFMQRNVLGEDTSWKQRVKSLQINRASRAIDDEVWLGANELPSTRIEPNNLAIIPNYGDYGYGIFLLDPKSRDFVLKNIQNEKDPFLRSMMWGALWDSVREGELDPRDFVELVVKVQSASFSSSERDKSRTLSEDESTTALLLNRVGTAMNYYIDGAGTQAPSPASAQRAETAPVAKPIRRPADAVQAGSLRSRVEEMLIERMQKAQTLGQRITYYRAFLNVASSEKARRVFKEMLTAETQRRGEGTGGNLSGSEGVSLPPNKNTLPTGRVSASGRNDASVGIPLKTKDRFDIVTRLLILNDPEAPKLLADLEKTETSDDAKRYAFAAKAGIPTAENKAKYWNDFVNNKEISESWIEAAFGPWNSIRHSELTLPFLQKALQELPNHKRNRKIFFVNGWLGAFIGGQRSEEALAIVNKFLADNPDLDNDLRLKILENVDLIERAVKIRAKYGKK